MAAYLRDEAAAEHVGWSINVVDLRGDRIREVTTFIGAEHIDRFRLPSSLP